MNDIPSNRPKVKVFVGTRKGGFIFTSDRDRKNWSVSDLHFKSWNVMHMQLDSRDQRLHAAIVHDVYGPSTFYSDDFGQSWTQAREGPAFQRPSKTGRPLGTPEEALEAVVDVDAIALSPEKINKIWNITPGRVDEPGVLYAGIEPAALFKSTNRGETWTVNESLFDHSHRSLWFPGAGGLCLHTIILDPTDHQRMFVAISTGGCYRTDDGGLTWHPHNKNVRADFLPPVLSVEAAVVG